MISNYELMLVKLALKLSENQHLSVAEVQEFFGCDAAHANELMHQLTLVDLAYWNTVTGEIDFNILWH